MKPSSVSRLKVSVEMRDSRSTWPEASTDQRCCTVVGVYFTLFASPKMAAATERQRSTSSPFQTPLSSGNDQPGMPVWTPHSRWPRAFTAARVGLLAPGETDCAPAAIGQPAASASAAAASPVMMFRIFRSPLPSR